MGKLEANHWASRVAEQTAVELRQMVEGMRGPECLLLPLPIFTFIPTLPFEPRLDSDPPSSFLSVPCTGSKGLHHHTWGVLILLIHVVSECTSPLCCYFSVSRM